MMYTLHTLIVITIVAIILTLGGCSTAAQVKEDCEYELVPDPSGSAKWRVVCHPIEEDDGECSCWEDLDPIGDKINEVENESKR